MPISVRSRTIGRHRLNSCMARLRVRSGFASQATGAATLACMTGGIAQAYYKAIPESILTEAKTRLPSDFIAIIDEFEARFHFP